MGWTSFSRRQGGRRVEAPSSWQALIQRAGDSAVGENHRDLTHPAPNQANFTEASMPNIGPMEILIVLIIALVLFGPKRLPELGKSLGKGISEFKGSIGSEHNEAEKPAALEKAPVAVAHGPATKADAAADL